ncbi:DivIVA domain repeat protein [Scardovia wiggsiae F0424]|uniref:DivIVA domain repeat protein n=1 Tax=Scardovia wiggsiae F0424 TaxID=857290 RepID=J0WZI1_9BIFI|nr:DivIVA domain-containing protein [Scardovia wiggsiae]EJD64516.1 DivIVA domain repeat protein [Scardovia wiggsiae F0424]
MTGEEQARGNRLPLADRNKWGYDIDQVDEFLDRAHQLYDAAQPQLNQEDIQNVLFTLVRGGYDIEAVDRALLRLEQAAVDKQTSYEISSEGRVAWRTKTVQLAQTLMPRANAGNGYRFADGHGKEPSYDRKQVDSFVVNAVTRICDELGIEYPQAVSSSNFDSDEDFTPRYVSTILFTQRKGDRGYDEGQVDMYVNRISQVVSRIVSFRNFEGVDVKEALGGSAADGDALRPYEARGQNAQYEDVASLEESVFAAHQAQGQAEVSGSTTDSGHSADSPAPAVSDGAAPETLHPYEGAMPVSFAPSSSPQRGTDTQHKAGPGEETELITDLPLSDGSGAGHPEGNTEEDNGNGGNAGEADTGEDTQSQASSQANDTGTFAPQVLPFLSVSNSLNTAPDSSGDREQ